MKRLVLFSSPRGKNFEEILKYIFPPEMENKILGYLPVSGKKSKEEYTNRWKEIAEQHNAKFLFVDSTNSNSQEEKEKLNKANILVITGGNTFELLKDLKVNCLFDSLKSFIDKSEFVVAGWSAGALLISPTIELSGRPSRDGIKWPSDKNKWKLTDLTGLGFVDFEVFPHYEEDLHKNTFEEYNKKKNGRVKALTDDDYIVINL